jgi:hypothetical protein
LCVAIDPTGSAAVSTDPSGGAASWTVTRIDTNPLGIAGISCNRSFCMVTDDVGAVVVGIPVPRPTAAQLQQALRKQLIPSRRGAAFLLRHRGYRYSFRMPVAGQLTISWYASAARGGPARQRFKPILIAAANAPLGSYTTDTVKIRLTRAGRRLLRRAAPLAVTAEARFTTAQHTLVTRATFTLGAASV